MYNILRWELTKNKEGLDEIFFSIEIIDEQLSNYNFAKWLSVNETYQFLEGIKTKEELIDKYLDLAREFRIKEINLECDVNPNYTEFKIGGNENV